MLGSVIEAADAARRPRREIKLFIGWFRFWILAPGALFFLTGGTPDKGQDARSSLQDPDIKGNSQPDMEYLT